VPIVLDDDRDTLEGIFESVEHAGRFVHPWSFADLWPRINNSTSVALSCHLWQVTAMNWHDLLTLVGGSTLFDSSMLLAGADPPPAVRRQLSRWVASGRLVQLRRGLYAVAPPFARAAPDVLAVAARIRRPSYVSLQSALSYHGVIPESVHSVTSVTTGRPGRYETALGHFTYRHVGPQLFWGYREVGAGGGGSAYVALSEKALLDLFHLTPGDITASFVRELRLAPGAVDGKSLLRCARRAARPKLIRAAAVAVRVLEEAARGARRL
jgi:hypothetical protein